MDVGNAQAVWLNGKIYVGGGTTSLTFRDDARLYIYTPKSDTWDILDTPVYHFGLTTYHSQLVLVGGVEYVSGLPTNKLWTLSEHDQWQEILPPMPKACDGASAVSRGDHLLVIRDIYADDKVYVYNGHQWASAQQPPEWLLSIKSTVVNNHWYLMGELFLSQNTYVYFASLDGVIASCQPSETSPASTLWKKLTYVPGRPYYPAVFGKRLIAVAGGKGLPISLYAYSSFTESWVHMGDAPGSIVSCTPCTLVLPSNELMVVTGQRTFKVTIKCK